MLGVTCQVSVIACNLKIKIRFIKETDKVVELAGGGSVIKGATPSS